MNAKKNFKRFWTMRKHTGGFTLVELVVVIAILAILAGIGIPAYSGYIAKANMAADQKLIGEVKQALELGYYAGNHKGNAYVVLGPNTSDLYYGEDSNVAKSLTAVFGENFAEQLVLKYDGWTATYQASNFFGNEIALLGKVDTLTSVLAAAIANNPDLVGTSFAKYLTGINIDADDRSEENLQKIADAAVLYVAKTSGKSDPAAAANAMVNLTNYRGAGEALPALQNAFGGSTVAAAAALYAVAEGYCQYEKNVLNNSEPMKTLNAATEGLKDGTYTPDVAFSVLYDAFNQVAAKATVEKDKDGNVTKHGIQEYFSNSAKADAGAYLDVLGTVSGAEKTVLDKVSLGSSDCFSNDVIKDIFSAYAEGGVVIMLETEDNGDMTVVSSIDE